MFSGLTSKDVSLFLRIPTSAQNRRPQCWDFCDVSFVPRTHSRTLPAMPARPSFKRSVLINTSTHQSVPPSARQITHQNKKHPRGVYRSVFQKTCTSVDMRGFACRHLCRNTIGVGVNRDGAFAEYLCIPEVNAFKIPSAVPDEIASIFDPFGNATHTTLSFDLVGEDVLITGAGPIGIMAAGLARHAGARMVVVTDVNDYRLSLARKFGVTRTVNVMRENLEDVTWNELGFKEGYDVGLEMSGNNTAFGSMLSLMKHGGKIALLGLPSKDCATHNSWKNSFRESAPPPSPPLYVCIFSVQGVTTCGRAGAHTPDTRLAAHASLTARHAPYATQHTLTHQIQPKFAFCISGGIMGCLSHGSRSEGRE